MSENCRLLTWRQTFYDGMFRVINSVRSEDEYRKGDYMKAVEGNRLTGGIGAAGEILAAGFGWGIIGVFSRPLANAGLSVVQITALRCVIVMISMALLLFFTEKKHFCIQLRDFWIFLGMGILSLVFFNVCYFITIENATLAAASILLYTAPFFVLLMSAIFFHERMTKRKISALILAFFGCMLVSGFSGGHMSRMAVLSGVASGFCYALYSIFGTAALRKYHPFTVVFYAFLVAALSLIPFVKMPEVTSILAKSPILLGKGMALGVVSTFLPFVLYTTGLRQMEAGKASVLAFAEPMVAAMAGILIFGEMLCPQNMIGIILIFTALVMLNYRSGKEE